MSPSISSSKKGVELQYWHSTPSFPYEREYRFTFHCTPTPVFQPEFYRTPRYRDSIS